MGRGGMPVGVAVGSASAEPRIRAAHTAHKTRFHILAVTVAPPFSSARPRALAATSEPARGSFRGENDSVPWTGQVVVRDRRWKLTIPLIPIQVDVFVPRFRGRDIHRKKVADREPLTVARTL